LILETEPKFLSEIMPNHRVYGFEGGRTKFQV